LAISSCVMPRAAARSIAACAGVSLYRAAHLLATVPRIDRPSAMRWAIGLRRSRSPMSRGVIERLEVLDGTRGARSTSRANAREMTLRRSPRGTRVIVLAPIAEHRSRPVDWYDTSESVAPNVNTPTSIHGQVMPFNATIPGNLQVFYPTPSYRLGPIPSYDLGGYNGAAPLGLPSPDGGVGSFFAVTFTDGWDTAMAPNGQGGIYTATASP